MKVFIIAAGVGASLFMGLSPANAIPSSCDAVAGNLVANCGFEANGGAYPNNWTPDAGYILEAGSFNRVISGAPTFCHSGSNCLSIGDYSREGYAGISQNISTTPGDLYKESFYFLNGSPGAGGESLEALVNGTVKFSTDGSTDTGGWQLETFTFTATAALTEIGFKAYNDPSEYYLDDIVVTSTSVPEPGTLALFGMGLLVLGGLGLRRKSPNV